MTYDDDLGPLLYQAFEAKAHTAVPQDRAVPGLTVPHRPSPRAHGVLRRAAPILAAAAVAAVSIGLVTVVRDRSPSAERRGVVPASPSRSSGAASIAPGRAVPVSVALQDGATVGVGMPIVVTFPVEITDGRALARATTVTVNGARADGAWYFVARPATGRVMEARYRTRDYWPAHARIHLSLRLKGVSAGKGLVFANDVSLDFATGAANRVTVDASTHTLTLTSDGVRVASYPVSLGAPGTPTSRGIKVITAKRDRICLQGPGYHICDIRYAQQLAASGEYLLAAPWNLDNLGRADTSGGSTDLSPSAAQTLYRVLRVGDVVEFPDASGPSLPLGYADWDVPWPVWSGGGAVPTR